MRSQSPFAKANRMVVVPSREQAHEDVLVLHLTSRK
jgi:hypothetical protein